MYVYDKLDDEVNDQLKKKKKYSVMFNYNIKRDVPVKILN